MGFLGQEELREPQAHREGVLPVSDTDRLTSGTSLAGEGETLAVPWVIVPFLLSQEAAQQTAF